MILVPLIYQMLRDKQSQWKQFRLLQISEGDACLSTFHISFTLPIIWVKFVIWACYCQRFASNRPCIRLSKRPNNQCCSQNCLSYTFISCVIQEVNFLAILGNVQVPPNSWPISIYSLDFFDFSQIITLDFFIFEKFICLDYFFFVSLQRKKSFRKCITNES